MRLCSVDGCGYKHSAKGYCEAHYQRLRNGREIDGPISRTADRPAECLAEDCTAHPKARGYCQVHYMRLLRGHDLTKPVRRLNPGEWSDWAPTVDGYIRRHRTLKGAQEYEIQHRVVMEAQLGRKLLSDESVHHKNGNRADNRPENLELWSRYQPAGQRVEDKLAWALEIVERYAPEQADPAPVGPEPKSSEELT